MDTREEQNKVMIENQLRLVMIDRMLKEKYNEIEYLAIQPSADPNIAEINKQDLDWLLSEHARCEELEQCLAERCNAYELRCAEQMAQYEEQVARYNELYERHQAVINSNAWRWGLRFAKIVHFFLTPIRALRGGK